MARILIIGGSLGGLLAANMLLRDGHDVLVFERATGSMDGRGAGIVTHQALNIALLRAGLNEIKDIGVKVERRVVLSQDGTVSSCLDMPQVLTSWSRLYRLLKDIFPSERYVQNATIVALQNNDDHVVAQIYRNGALVKEIADLVIGCDGIRSSVRAQFAPHIKANYAGYIAWRAICDEAVLSRNTLDTLFETFGFGLPEGEQILGYPVAGIGNSTVKGTRSYNLVWYRSANESAAADLMTDSDGVIYPQGIPPAKISPFHIANMRLAAQDLLAPQFAEIIEKTTQPFLQPIYDLNSESMAFGRVALLGDAAFVARPHVGMGVTKAAQDACVLVDSIHTYGATATALQHYAALRVPEGRAVVQLSRDLGARMQAKRNVEFDDAWVLRTTAVDSSSVNFSTPVV